MQPSRTILFPGWARMLAAVIVVSLLSDISWARHPRDLWFYYPTNLQVAENIDKLGPIWRRAAAAGYTRVLLADSKFVRLGTLPDFYFKNVDRVKALARELHLQIVPAVFPIGYSNDLLFHNPNLAEGLPVVDAPFVVKGDVAITSVEKPIPFDVPDWKDEAVDITDGVATVSAFAENARFVFKRQLPKYHAYHISVDIRTTDFIGEPRVAALGKGRSLQYANLGVKPTQDWTTHHVVFNTLDSDEVGIYLGAWGGGKGVLQWRNWKIEPAGLNNLLRRPGAPFKIDGLIEGKDYEKVVDPASGTIPYNGEFTVWHESPSIKLTKRIVDGTILKVSYTHAITIYDGQVSACVSEPETDALLQDQAERMRKLWEANAYMMSHDEFRVGGWDAACVARKQTMGQILASNVRKCTEWIAPNADTTAYVWSDMFDPFHNAVNDYYLVKGDLAGSWEGLDRKVGIVNWNFGKRDESLKFFADRGHKQVIAGFYDGPVENVAEWLIAAERVPGVTGIMYTTWRGDYGQLERFATVVQTHNQ